MTLNTKKSTAKSRKNPVNKKGKNSQKRKNSKKRSSWKWKLFKFCMLTFFGLFLVVSAYIFYCYLTMPDIQKALNKSRQPYTVILAENGSEIAKFGNVYAQIIYPDKLPKNLANAVVAIEDRRFYSHFGFDVLSFSRAMLTNIFRKRYAQGASTITQQVAKNIFLTPNKNIKRKVQELLLAFWLEKKLTKNQILALYLNRVYFGSGNYGAQAAANWYFSKDVNDLNLREASILAGMLKAPNRYNPILQRQKSLERSNVVLQTMYKNKFITKEQLEKAKKQSISNGQQYRLAGGKYFAQYVYNEVNDFIGERNDDIIVITTLDQALQETAEKVLRRKIFAAKDKNVTQGAVIIMDKSGGIKAMVGGIDYNRSQFNRAVQAKRQAGSAFKPFVYLTALQYGFTPETTVEDAPVTIGKWSPTNYTKRYYGNVTLLYALANSLNVATVVLSRELYLKDIAQNAYKMGITTKLNLSPSMVLGTNEVKLIDMATAYTVMANGGKSVWPHAIDEITYQDGTQLYVRQTTPAEQIIKPEISKQMSQMLEKVITQGTGHNARLPIFAAGKTGTTQNYRDAWFIGWTNKYVAAVWVGNDNEKPMNKVGGGNLPAEIWHDIMLTTLKDTPSVDSADDINSTSDDSQTDDAIGELIEEENLSSNNENSVPQNLEELIDSL